MLIYRKPLIWLKAPKKNPHGTSGNDTLLILSPFDLFWHFWTDVRSLGRKSDCFTENVVKTDKIPRQTGVIFDYFWCIQCARSGPHFQNCQNVWIYRLLGKSRIRTAFYSIPYDTVSNWCQGWDSWSKSAKCMERCHPRYRLFGHFKTHLLVYNDLWILLDFQIICWEPKNGSEITEWRKIRQRRIASTHCFGSGRPNLGVLVNFFSQISINLLKKLSEMRDSASHLAEMRIPAESDKF